MIFGRIAKCKTHKRFSQLHSFYQFRNSTKNEALLPSTERMFLTLVIHNYFDCASDTLRLYSSWMMFPYSPTNDSLRLMALSSFSALNDIYNSLSCWSLISLSQGKRWAPNSWQVNSIFWLILWVSIWGLCLLFSHASDFLRGSVE